MKKRVKAVLVNFDGKRVTLSSLANKHGIGTATLYGRWKRAGKPETITKAMLIQVTDKSVYKPFTLLPEGSVYSAKELAANFNVIAQDINNRMFLEGKTEYTRKELSDMSDCSWGFEEEGRGKLTIDDVDFNPSPMERALLAL